MMWLLASLALAGDVHLVRTGETVTSIATALGDAGLADTIRSENRLSGDALVPGTLLRLPDVPGRIASDAVVLSLSGTAHIIRPDGRIEPLAVTATVPAGSKMCTEPDAFATLRLAADPTTGMHDDANLGPGTCVRIEGASVSETTRTTTLTVEQGNLEVRSAEGEGAGLVNVLTPAGATTGSGGGFRVALEEEGSQRTEALTSAVAVIGAGVEVDVGSGQGTRTNAGEAPQDPVDLLLPGQPERPEEGAALFVHDFKWSAVDDALGYRLQISGAPDFSEIVFSTDVPRAKLAPETLFLPQRLQGLWWRVTAFDYAGFEGLPSEPRRLVVPR